MKYLTHPFFKDFSKVNYYTSIRPGNRVGDPVVTDIRAILYHDGVIQVKLDFSDEFSDLPRNAKANGTIPEEVIKALYDCEIKLKPSKYQHLQQLKDVVPSEYHQFYDTLPH